MISELASIDPAKVATYIRWSTEDQGEGTTLDVQSDTCKAYLTSQGWVVNAELVFIDDGYSGGTLDRPAMTRLRQAVTNREVDCVVVYKLDRLSRSVVDTVNLICREWDGKCSIKSAREPIDTTSHAGKMFFYTLINFAEWERSVIKERTYSGKLRRAQEGKNPGMRPPFGYNHLEGGDFGINVEEAAIVHRIYHQYLSGMGVAMIVRYLNQEGYKPRMSSHWANSSINRILSNPAYIGRLEYGRRRTIGNSRIKKEAVVVTESSRIPPLISKEDWHSVQAIKSTRPGFGRGLGSGRSNTSESLLSGLLKCRCGSSYSGKSMSGQYRYYRCVGVQMKSSLFCDAGGVRQEVLDDLVVKSLKAFHNGNDAMERITRKLALQWNLQLAEAVAHLAQLEKELGRVQVGEQRLKKLLRDGEISVTEYRELKEDHDRESQELKDANEMALASERHAKAGIQGQARLLQSLSKVDDWEQLDHQAQKLLLRQLIREIRLYKNKKGTVIECHIVWEWDSATFGAPPNPVSEEFAEQTRPLPPKNEVRDASGRFSRKTGGTER